MFRTEYNDPQQLRLDLRFPIWRQLELNLEYLPQPDRVPDEWGLRDTSLYFDTSVGASDFTISPIAPTLHINSSPGTESKSRLIVTPDLVIESSHKRPNAIVRFFHKHLLNFTWEKI